MLSAIENRMSSLLTKSETGIVSTSWSRNVPGCEISKSKAMEPYLVEPEPFFSIIGFSFVKGHVDEVSVLRLDDVELEAMLAEIAEVLFRVARSARSETLHRRRCFRSKAHFVVFRLPPSTIVVALFPFFVLRHRVKADFLLALPDFDDGGDEFDQEARNAEEGGVEMIQEVNE